MTRRSAAAKILNGKLKSVVAPFPLYSILFVLLKMLMVYLRPRVRSLFFEIKDFSAPRATHAILFCMKNLIIVIGLCALFASFGFAAGVTKGRNEEAALHAVDP